MDINKLSDDEQMQLLQLLEDRSKIITATNKVYIPLYTDQSRYMVLMGGGGSGKSIFAGQKLLRRITTETGHRILVVRKVARTLRESCFQQLKSQIVETYNYEDFDVNKTDMRIVYKRNGNEILFAGLDDVQKLKSIYNITCIWIEEASEIEADDYRQLDIRLRGQTAHYKQMIFTFNPVSIMHWLKTEFFDNKRPDATVLQTTYKDNRFIDAEAIKVLEAFKDTDPYYYAVYCLGEWGVLGKTIFDSQAVNARISQVRYNKPCKVGYFDYQYINDKIIDSTIRFVEDTDGYITIYEDTKRGYPYVIGGDTAGDGSDYFACHVIDNTNGKQVCVYHKQQDEDLFTKQIYCLGKYYNNALIGLEANFSTYPIKELQRIGYYNQFARQEEDTMSGQYQKKYGFKTTKLTRPLIISELVEIVREHVDRFNDLLTLTEMLTFVRNDKGRAEAQAGAHDDLVISLAIAYYVRDQQRYTVEIETTKDDDEDEDIIHQSNTFFT
jgi:phage terminase large subunit